MSHFKPKYFYDLICHTAERFPDKESFFQRKPSGKLEGISFRHLKKRVDQLSAALIDSGLAIGDRVALLCDASPNWILADLSIITSGGVSVPRGLDVVEEDILYILNHSEATICIVQTEEGRDRLHKLKSKLTHLKEIIVLENSDGELAIGAGSATEWMDKGKLLLSTSPTVVTDRVHKTDPDDLATLIYTSGTTGAPKGVMLGQTGWIQAVEKVMSLGHISHRDSGLSLLPPWHAFERAIEYAIIYLGSEFTISDRIHLREDLKDARPTLFPSVPRIWESLYNGIMGKVNKEKSFKKGLFYYALRIGEAWANEKANLFGYRLHIRRPDPILEFFHKIKSLFHLFLLMPPKLLSILVFKPVHDAMGGRIRLSISAGSALPSNVDRFLTAIGLSVLEGYGMTETSAVVSTRDPHKPTRGTVGAPVDGYEIRLKDEQNKVIPDPIGKKGTLWVKSDQILQGYYKRPELNEESFDSDGFFNTGDIMTLTYRGELLFSGRQKDTIVLAGGENIEPVPIEDQLLNSPYIDQVMVTGHESKTLLALIVPNYEAVETAIPQAPKDRSQWNNDSNIRELFKKEVAERVSRKNGFKSFEQIPGNAFHILGKPFDPDTEMTRTLKLKRNIILEDYAREIKALRR